MKPNIDRGHPKLIDRWPGLFPENLDAAVLRNNGNAYFLKGEQYTRWDMDRDEVDHGYPKLISDEKNWPGLFASNIDTAIY